MYNRFKASILSFSDTQRLLINCKVDKTHSMMTNRGLAEIGELMKSIKKRNQLASLLYKKIHCEDMTLRIKSIVVMHYCLRAQFDDGLVELLEKLQVKQSTSRTEIKSYMENNVVNFYILYLKKICMDSESYNFVRHFSKLKDCTKIQMMSHGFKIVNLMNFILQSQEMFNKMGRYHSTHNQIINMYLQLLHDLDYFNIFIKKSITILLREPNSTQKSSEQTKHCYLFITEAQKISDRLYQFYHNRYYYKIIRSMVSFPSFLQIDNDDFKKVKSQAKQVDRNLVRMVTESKYDRRVSTQGNFNKTVSYDTKALTETFEYTRDAYSNIMYEISEKINVQEVALDEQTE